jgi:hypothetical protein
LIVANSMSVPLAVGMFLMSFRPEPSPWRGAGRRRSFAGAAPAAVEIAAVSRPATAAVARTFFVNLLIGLIGSPFPSGGLVVPR